MKMIHVLAWLPVVMLLIINGLLGHIFSGEWWLFPWALFSGGVSGFFSAHVSSEYKVVKK